MAIEPSILLALTKQGFKASIADRIMLEKRTNFQFVSSVSLFQNWPSQSMFGLLTHIKIKNCSMGEYIYKKGQRDNNIYMVYKGEVQIYSDSFRDKVTDDQDDPFSLKTPGSIAASDFKSVDSNDPDYEARRRKLLWRRRRLYRTSEGLLR